MRRLVDARGMARRTPAPGSPHRPPTTRAAPPPTSSSTTAARPRRCAPPSTSCGTAGSCPSRPTCGPRRPVLAPPDGRAGPAVGGRRCPARRPGRPGGRPGRAGRRPRGSDGRTRAARRRRHGPPVGVDPVEAARPIETVRAGLDAAGFPRTDDAAGRRSGGVVARRRRPRPSGAGGAAAGGSPAWRAALLWRDWLRADAAARAAYGTGAAVPGSTRLRLPVVHPSGGMGRIVGVDTVVRGADGTATRGVPATGTTIPVG